MVRRADIMKVPSVILCRYWVKSNLETGHIRLLHNCFLIIIHSPSAFLLYIICIVGKQWKVEKYIAKHQFIRDMRFSWRWRYNSWFSGLLHCGGWTRAFRMSALLPSSGLKCHSWLSRLLRRVVWWLDASVSEDRAAFSFRIEFSAYSRLGLANYELQFMSEFYCKISPTFAFTTHISVNFQFRSGNKLLVLSITCLSPTVAG